MFGVHHWTFLKCDRHSSVQTQYMYICICGLHVLIHAVTCVFIRISSTYMYMYINIQAVGCKGLQCFSWIVWQSSTLRAVVWLDMLLKDLSSMFTSQYTCTSADYTTSHSLCNMQVQYMHEYHHHRLVHIHVYTCMYTVYIQCISHVDWQHDLQLCRWQQLAHTSTEATRTCTSCM